MIHFLKKALSDMKQSAAAQHEVDKANFEAVKAESRANFAEHRGCKSVQKMREARAAEIFAAKERIEAANARYEAAKKSI